MLGTKTLNSLADLNAALVVDVARLRRHGSARKRHGARYLTLVALAVVSGFFTFVSVSAFQTAERQFSLVGLEPNAPEPEFLGIVGSAAVHTANFLLAQSEQRLEGETQNRVNILLLGMAGQPNPAPYLTDTILVISIEPSSGKVALVSVPRDLLVQTDFAKGGLRVNSLYQYGLINNPQTPESLILQIASRVTGLEIKYWLSFDLTVVKGVVDAMGGVDVFVTDPIYDPLFPGPNFSYDPFSLDAGFQRLDGATAAKYVRSRYSQHGDFDRVQRQREVVEALARTLKDLNPLWEMPRLLDIYESLHGHLATNLEMRQVRRLYELLKDTDGREIYDASLSAEPNHGLLKDATTGYGAAVLVPRPGFEQYGEIQAFFGGLFNKF